MTYETAASRPARNYPESWGTPRGAQFSTERRAWVARNLTSNPKFKLEQLRAVERRNLREEIDALDDKLRLMGITPPPLDF